MSDQDLFKESCKASELFPENVVRHNTYRHTLKTYRSILNERAGVLFCADGKALLELWDYHEGQPEFRATKVFSRFELKAEFEGESLFDQKDPQCRYLFIHARHSRDRLRISRDMFVYALTYHQVMPEFLEFIFPFGWQEYQEDFNFSGFRGETRLLGTERGLNIRMLERSGQDFRMCYALRSVEKSSEEGWPWSIRLTAVYHSFEVDTGKIFWVIVKGNELMRDRVQAETEPEELDKSQTSNFGKRFAVALETHLIVCGWAVENWRWYINFVGKRLEDLTRHSLAIRVTKARSIIEPLEIENPQTFANQKKSTTWKRFVSATLRTPPVKPATLPGPKMQSRQIQPSGPPPPPPPPPPLYTPDTPWKPAQPGQVPSGEPEFTFHDLQEIQAIEDRLNMTVQVLINNTKILQELKDFYKSLFDLREFPCEMSGLCEKDLAKFLKRLTSIMAELQMHKSRAETLLRLLADRKTLLYGILEYRAMEANRLLAKRAQESAERMEDMTKEMNHVALKTRDETVSMKIITLVTLFYLPGTFMSTVMSTDIITFPAGDGGLQWPALRVWLEVTVPLTLCTFVAWVLVYNGYGKGWFNRKSQSSSGKPSFLV